MFQMIQIILPLSIHYQSISPTRQISSPTVVTDSGSQLCSWASDISYTPRKRQAWLKKGKTINNTHLVNVLIEHIYVEFSGSTVIASLHSNGTNTEKKTTTIVRRWLRDTTETMVSPIVVLLLGVDPSRRQREIHKRKKTTELSHL